MDHTGAQAIAGLFGGSAVAIGWLAIMDLVILPILDEPQLGVRTLILHSIQHSEDQRRTHTRLWDDLSNWQKKSRLTVIVCMVLSICMFGIKFTTKRLWS